MKISSYCRLFLMLCLLGLAVTSRVSFATCVYNVDKAWTSGFNVTVTVTNHTASAVNGWSLSWQYTGDNRFVSSGDVTVSGTNPYTVTKTTALAAGAATSFTFKGSKTGAVAEVPALTGTLCSTTPTTSATTSKSASSASVRSSVSSAVSSRSVSSVTSSATSSVPPKVYIQVDKADDFLFVYVDGILKWRWAVPDWSYDERDFAQHARLGKKIDMTHLLGSGNNVIRIVAAANASDRVTGGYNVRIWKNSTVVMNEQKDFQDVAGISAIMLDKSITVNLSGVPAKRSLTINSNLGGEAIYINNTYTGKTTPATFSLAPGDYRIGLGESTSTNDWNRDTVDFTGKFREKDITISSQNISLTAANIPLVTKVNSWKVAIVPYAKVYQGLTRAQAAAKVIPPKTDIGILTNDDIQVTKKSVEVTSAKWVEPMAYGLLKWNVTVLPTVTQPVYHAFDEGIGHELLWNPSMVNADLTQYDMVVHVIPTRTSAIDAYGNRIYVVHAHGGYGGRPDVMMPADWLDGEGGNLTERLASVKPSALLLHESLHNIEAYRLLSYTGIDHLHGAEVHGYVPRTCDMPNEYLCWYARYIRSQVGETSSMRFDIYSPAPVSGTSVSTYIGIFDVTRGGKGVEQLWSFNKSFSSIQNLATNLCVDLPASTANGTAIPTVDCSGGVSQRWSFTHVQNGAYQWVTNSNTKCAELIGPSLTQQKCSVVLSQRFLLKKNSNGSYQIRTLSDSCLALTTSNTIVAQACVSGEARQSWNLNP